LIRVLGHELRNSLAPIISIAGSLGSLLASDELPADWRADARSGLKVIETRDPTPFLDARPEDGGVAAASPVQAYLELATAGDKRDTEMAGEIRARILRDLAR